MSHHGALHAQFCFTFDSSLKVSMACLLYHTHFGPFHHIYTYEFMLNPWLKLGLHGSCFGHVLSCLLKHICVRYCMISWLGKAEFYTAALFIKWLNFVLIHHLYIHKVIWVSWLEKKKKKIYTAGLSPLHHLVLDPFFHLILLSPSPFDLGKWFSWHVGVVLVFLLVVLS